MSADRYAIRARWAEYAEGYRMVRSESAYADIAALLSDLEEAEADRDSFANISHELTNQIGRQSVELVALRARLTEAERLEQVGTADFEDELVSIAPPWSRVPAGIELPHPVYVLRAGGGEAMTDDEVPE